MRVVAIFHQLRRRRRLICRIDAMHLESTIIIRRSPEEVGRFLSDIANVEKWDRGVGGSSAISGSSGVGFEFETLGRLDSAFTTPEKARMAYRIVHAEPDR